MPDQVKKFLRFLGVGAAWIFFVSIPLKGRPIFFQIYETIVPNSLANAIGNQAEMAWYRSKALARSALSDAEETGKPRF